MFRRNAEGNDKLATNTTSKFDASYTILNIEALIGSDFNEPLSVSFGDDHFDFWLKYSFNNIKPQSFNSTNFRQKT